MGKASFSARSRNSVVSSGACGPSPIASPLSPADTSSCRKRTCGRASAGTLCPFDMSNSPGASHSRAFGRSDA